MLKFEGQTCLPLKKILLGSIVHQVPPTCTLNTNSAWATSGLVVPKLTLSTVAGKCLTFMTNEIQCTVRLKNIVTSCMSRQPSRLRVELSLWRCKKSEGRIFLWWTIYCNQQQAHCTCGHVVRTRSTHREQRDRRPTVRRRWTAFLRWLESISISCYM